MKEDRKPGWYRAYHDRRGWVCVGYSNDPDVGIGFMGILAESLLYIEDDPIEFPKEIPRVNGWYWVRFQGDIYLCRLGSWVVAEFSTSQGWRYGGVGCSPVIIGPRIEEPPND
jgi:hypothetical protein